MPWGTYPFSDQVFRIQLPVFHLSDQNGYNLYPISDQKSSETIPFGVTHTDI